MPDTLEPSFGRPLQPECLPFDEDDIARCFPGGIGKARPYQRRGAVRDLRADKGGQRLIASVQGTRPRPYHVFVEIGSSDPVKLSAQCSCPVGRS
ncbi:MAG: SWIM zinc finger family protein, partial [Stellaceae bacterium]